MTALRIGYARVSIRDQSLDLQRDVLRAAGCERIFEDTVSGFGVKRPGFTQALDQLREGDTLVVWRLDRLGRSVKDLLDFFGGLNDQGIGFISLTESIDTTTVHGPSLFKLMASLAQMDRELMNERMKRRLQARAQGRTGGRKRIMEETRIRLAAKLLSQGVPAKEVAASLGVSEPTLYRWVPAANPAASTFRGIS